MSATYGEPLLSVTEKTGTLRSLRSVNLVCQLKGKGEVGMTPCPSRMVVNTIETQPHVEA